MKSRYQTLPDPIITAILLVISIVIHLGPPYVVQAADNDEKGIKFECVGTYGETIQSLAQYSHYVFLNQGFTLRALDIQDPAHPRQVLWRRFDAKIESLVIKYPALYIGYHAGYVLILDISDPANPTQRAILPNPEAFSYGHMNLEIMGDFLLVETAHGKSTAYDVYHVNNPFGPVKRLNGYRSFIERDHFIFATDGFHLYSAKPDDEADADDEDTRHVFIQDVTTSPTTLSQQVIPVADEIGFSLKAGRLLTGDSVTTTTIQPIDFSKSTSVWAYHSKGGAEVVQEARQPGHDKIIIQQQFTGDHEDDGIRIIDAPKGSSKVRCVYGDNPGVMQFKIVGNRGYLIDDMDGMQILDMTDPANPRRLSRTILYDHAKQSARQSDTPRPAIRALEDNLAFITCRDNGYLIFDCSKPTSPTLRARYDGPVGPTSIQGLRAYVAAGKNGLQILDLSNPGAIRPLGNYSTLNPASDLATSGSLVYLMAKALLIIDTANPAKPNLIGKTALSFEDQEGGPMESEDVQIKKVGAAVYAVQLGHHRVMNASCRVIDVSNPMHPRLLPDLINVEAPDEEALKAGSITMSIRSTAPTGGGWYLCLPSSLSSEHGGWGDVYYEADLTVFELSDPFKPTQVFRTNAMQTDNNVALYKNTLYLADGDGGLVIMRPLRKTHH